MLVRRLFGRLGRSGFARIERAWFEVTTHGNRRHDHDVARTTEPVGRWSWTVRSAAPPVPRPLPLRTAPTPLPTNSRRHDVRTPRRHGVSGTFVSRRPRRFAVQRSSAPSTLCHGSFETRGQLASSVLHKICCSILIGWRTIQMGWTHGTGNDEERESRTLEFLCGICPHLRFRSKEIDTGRSCGTGLGGAD